VLPDDVHPAWSHRDRGGGVAEQISEKLAGALVGLMLETFGGLLTVSVAALVVALPPELVKIARYCVLLSALCAANE